MAGLDLTVFIAEGGAATNWITAGFTKPIPAVGSVCYQTENGSNTPNSVQLASATPQVRACSHQAVRTMGLSA